MKGIRKLYCRRAKKDDLNDLQYKQQPPPEEQTSGTATEPTGEPIIREVVVKEIVEKEVIKEVIVKDEAPKYVVPEVWSAGEIAPTALNRPTAGARHEQPLPVGRHDLQVYSAATPNGQKVTIMLEELLAAGHKAEYDAWLIHIMKSDQFGSEFVDVANPNSKIPALVDHTVSRNSAIFEMCGGNDQYTGDASKLVRVFESGSILLYLSEKFNNAFLPLPQRTEVLNWLFWQMGSAPYVGGGFGHFFQFAPEKQEYPINRFTMETKRQLDVLNRQLEGKRFVVGDEYTIADIAIFPWYGGLVMGEVYRNATTFLNVEEEYPNVVRWAREISERPAVKRGVIVNKVWGDGPQIAERHEAADIDAAFAAHAQKSLGESLPTSAEEKKSATERVDEPEGEEEEEASRPIAERRPSEKVAI